MAFLNQTYAEPDDFALLGFDPSFTKDTPVHEIRAQLEAASGFVASYLKAQFEMPLVRWGMEIRKATCSVAAWWIAVKRGYNPEAGADANIKAMYDEWKAWLEGVAAGDITPVLVDSTAGAAGQPMATSSSQRGFSTRGTARDPGPFESD